jgi:hypothetical protein
LHEKASLHKKVGRLHTKSLRLWRWRGKTAGLEDPQCLPAISKAMNITSRYSDIAGVVIDPAKIPAEFRHLLPLAKEWSISDDLELEAYIEAASEQQKQQLVAAFSPHFGGLWEWHLACEDKIPQPDELVLFDIAANAAASVHATMED